MHEKSDFNWTGEGAGYINVPLNVVVMGDAEFLAVWHELLHRIFQSDPLQRRRLERLHEETAESRLIDGVIYLEPSQVGETSWLVYVGLLRAPHMPAGDCEL